MILRLKRIFRKRQTTYRRGTEPSSQQTYRWLLWLATKLKQDNTPDFFIERMQPHWLDTKSQKSVYRISIGMITGLICGLLYAISTGLIGATIAGVTYGVILATVKEIYPVRKLKLSAEFAKLSLPRSLVEGLWWGVIYAPIDAIVCGLIWGIPGIIIGIVQVLIWGLVEGLIWGSFVPTFRKEIINNQGMRESAINAVIFTIIGGVIWLGFYLIWVWAAREPWEPESILLDTIVNGLFFGIYMGGFACLQHFILRLILVANGAMPWNYAKFLNYATKLGYLEREGGCYRFKYDLLESPNPENRQQFGN